MKLSKIGETFAEIVQSETAEARGGVPLLFLEAAKPQHRTKRYPQGVERNTAEEQQEQPIAG